jgi:hypothetical protein
MNTRQKNEIKQVPANITVKDCLEYAESHIDWLGKLALEANRSGQPLVVKSSSAKIILSRSLTAVRRAMRLLGHEPRNNLWTRKPD